MLRILKCLRAKEWLMGLACIILVIAQVWCDLKAPDYMQEITILSQTSGSSIAEIWKTGGLMLLCALGSLASAILAGFFAAKVASGFSKTLRNEVYDKVQNFSMTEISKFSTASLITRSTNDVIQVQMLVAFGLQVIVKAPITAVWAIVKILDKNWQWSVATAIAVVILMVIISIIVFLAFPKFKIVQTQTDRLNEVAQENLTGVRVIRAYNAETYQEDKFDEANSSLTQTQLFTSRTMSLLQPSINIVMNGLILAIYWIGAIIINEATSFLDKKILFGDMMAFTSYAMQIMMSFMMLVMIFIIMPRSLVSAKRISEVLSTKPEIVSGTASSDNQKKGLVQFKNVSFHYHDASEQVLTDINFTANQGETVAIIGATGSGKTTLVNLILRLFDVSEGEILIDSINVKDYKLEELRSKIGYAPQRATLFQGSIKSNLQFGDNFKGSDDENGIMQALDTAQALEFVSKNEDGVNASVSQNGSNFSGGQKQRLSIARAIYRNADILIFDDSFSALDYRTDRLLRSELKQKCQDVTTFIVAQRIGTIKDADKIIVIDQGKIVGMGKHNELLTDCPVYKEIALSQLSKEELES